MIRLLLKSLREFKKSSILAIILIGCEAGLEMSLPFIMSKMVKGIEVFNVRTFSLYATVMLIIATVSLLCGTNAGYEAAKASSGLAKNLRDDLFKKIQTLSFTEINKFSIPSLITRMTNDVANIQLAYEQIVRAAMRTPLIIIFATIMTALINKKIALIYIASFIPLAILVFTINIKVFPIFNRLFTKYDKINETVQENIEGIKVVKSFGREDHEEEKFTKANREITIDFINISKIASLIKPFMNLFLLSTLWVVNFYGAKLIIYTKSQELNVAQFSAIITYGVQILLGMISLSIVLIMCLISMESIKRVYEVLICKSSMIEKENGIKIMSEADIEFKNVSFKYVNESSKDILHDINLKIPFGSTLGILGKTGSSKSSLVQLIARLYDVTKGEILINNINICDYDISFLREKVAIVLQKNILFTGTIRENMLWGNQNATDEQIIKALKIAQAWDFVSKNKNGLDYKIERGGANFSGGQKQRLCIARAILKSPKVIIFDDSTSAVDTQTDLKIKKALKEELPNMTKIIVSQRVNSVKNADNIIILKKGEISECGKNDELLAKKGIYYEMAKSQELQNEELNENKNL